MAKDEKENPALYYSMLKNMGVDFNDQHTVESFLSGFLDAPEGLRKGAVVTGVRAALREKLPEPNYEAAAKEHFEFVISMFSLQLTAWTYARQELGIQASTEQMEQFAKEILRGLVNGWCKSATDSLDTYMEFAEAAGLRGNTPLLDKFLGRTPDDIQRNFKGATRTLIKLMAPALFDLSLVHRLSEVGQELKQKWDDDEEGRWKNGQPSVE